ncbi:cystatin-2-like [Phyllobates terribilis]|uniref:cystatin-2-like n=1 Tax=Phyllobates terribilis TaxID=111132 RepID=UPI003CCAD33B
MARLCVIAALLVCLSVVTQAIGLLGGREKADLDSKEVQRVLRFAMYMYNKENNDMYQARVVDVRNAEQQLVSGILYHFDVAVGRTQCRKPTTDESNCELHTDATLAKTTTCHFEVYTIPWRSSTKMKKSKCD